MALRPVSSRRDFLTLGRDEGRRGERYVHIGSLLVQIAPGRLPGLQAALAALPGAELHATAHPAKYAVVLEADDERALADATEKLFEVPGVLTVSIVAHLTERHELMEEDIADEPAPVPQA